MKEYLLSMLNFIILSFGAHQAIKLDFMSQIYEILRIPANVSKMMWNVYSVVLFIKGKQ